MSYNIRRPSFPLSLFVKQYWSLDGCPAKGHEHIQRIVPCGLMELMFYSGRPPSALQENKNLQDCSILSGQQNGYYDLLVNAEFSVFSVTFKPHGAKMFFNIPSNEFFDQNVPLKYLLKDDINKLEGKLHDADSFDSKVRIIETFLAGRLKKRHNDHEINRIEHIIELINKTKAITTIEELSSASCLSRKQFERIFSSNIGTSPKKFLRTIRFQNTLSQKQKDTRISLTQLAYSCGYFDQSHMINDYRILTGKTPGQYFSEADPYSDYFETE